MRPLVKQLEATGAREDAEIVQAAGRLLKLADARVVHQATVEDIVSVIVAGVHVGTIGDHGSYTVGRRRRGRASHGHRASYRSR
jgi:hypothetical protein